MKVTIEIASGAEHREPRRGDFDKQIAALDKASDGKPLSPAEQLLVFDSMTIIQGIKRKLEGG